MDQRLEHLKKMMNIKEIPRGAFVTFNSKNFPEFYPDFVKEAFSKIKVPLHKFHSEMKVSPVGNITEQEAAEYTYCVASSDLIAALEKVDPNALAWYQNRFLKDKDPKYTSVVFKNNTIEGIVD